MRFKELLSKFTWDQVKDKMIELYPDQENTIDGYMDVFLKLNAIEPEDNDMRIYVHMQSDILEEEPPFPCVSGRNGKLNRDTSPERLVKEENKEWLDSETVYAIEFEPWSQWLGMEIDNESYKDFTELEIVIHALWELTFMGFSEESVTEQKDILIARSEECKKEDSDEVISISDNVKIHRDVMDVLTEGMDDNEFIEFSEAMKRLSNKIAAKRTEAEDSNDSD
jgi:hypothetical protein